MMTSCVGFVANAAAEREPTMGNSVRYAAHMQVRLMRCICDSEGAIQELRRGPKRCEPGRVEQKAVFFVREDQRFRVHTLRAEAPHHIGGLIKRYAAIVIAMDKQYR